MAGFSDRSGGSGSGLIQSDVPFNGQIHRRRVIEDLVTRVGFDLVIETGTYRGASAKALHEISGVPVYTVEADPRSFFHAKRNLRRKRGITVVEGDSRTFLERASHDRALTQARTLFYLDAHWGSELPLPAELTVVSENWNAWVALIDDFQVPDDQGYAYDRYGPDQALTLAHVPEAVLASVDVFWPAASSDTETGSRRGSVVLCSREMTSMLTTIGSLRAGEIE